MSTFTYTMDECNVTEFGRKKIMWLATERIFFTKYSYLHISGSIDGKKKHN